MKIRLYKQYPKIDRKGIVGRMNMRAGERRAYFIDKKGCIRFHLNEPRIKCMSRDGILVVGYESKGHDEEGREHRIYQEWWVTTENLLEDQNGES